MTQKAKTGQAIRGIRRLFHFRRRLRRGLLYFFDADGVSDRIRLLGYGVKDALRAFGFLRIGEPYWQLRLRGLMIYLNPILAELKPYRSIFVKRDYEQDPLFAPEGAEVLLDVGANIGLYTLRMAPRMKNPRILAFEPNPQAYARLKQNIDANGLQGVKPLQFAVGAAKRRVYLLPARRSNLGQIREGGLGLPEEGFEVDMVTLDAITEEEDLSRIDILKIDVEGHEAEVLRGARRALSMTRCVVMEIHSEEVGKEVQALLSAAGFSKRLEFRGHAYFVNKNWNA